MRILITAPWGECLGGAEEMLQMAIDGASAAGHELEVVFFEPGPWPDQLRRSGLHVEVLSAGRLRQTGHLLATIVRLARILRRRRPDLILSWMTKTHLYGAPAAILAGMRGRVLWWQHGIPGRKDWLDRVASLLPALAVGCSSQVSARAQAKLFPHRRAFVVNPGARVPAVECESAPLQLPGGSPVVGLVGRLQPWKGQDRLLRAQAILHARGHTMHTLIVGGDAYNLSSEYADSLPQLVDGLGLAGAVTMTGQVPDAGPYIAQMDILVNASDPEPFGIVLLEGMARGVAVVAVASGGPRELVTDRETGLLARSGDPESLADALEPLLSSASLRRRIGEAGRARFMADYTDAAMCRRLYRELEGLRGTPVAAAGGGGDRG
jgi:glycosyltransferase involved in cell wall biosynthesis